MDLIVHHGFFRYFRETFRVYQSIALSLLVLSEAPTAQYRASYVALRNEASAYVDANAGHGRFGNQGRIVSAAIKPDESRAKHLLVPPLSSSSKGS